MEKKRNQIGSENDLDNFTVLEKPIALAVQKAYGDLSDSMDYDHTDYREVLREADKLFVERTPVEAKKRILVLLAHLGTMESSKVIEKYLLSQIPVSSGPVSQTPG